VVSISGILGQDAPDVAWRYELLFVPFLVPFVLAAGITAIIWRKQLPDGVSIAHPFVEAAHRCVAGLQRLIFMCLGGRLCGHLHIFARSMWWHPVAWRALP
jgi:hypothetical protein